MGPAVISTPRGRFHATAESDGGATIDCLAGRTRVVAGLREPVLLGPDQSAAVSSDGGTLVVMDRATVGALSEPDVIDLTDAADQRAADQRAAEIAAVELAAVGSGDGPTGALGPRLPSAPADEDTEVAPRPAVAAPVRDRPGDDGPPPPARLGWIPELVAVASVVALVVAAVWVFTQRDGGDEVATVASTATTVVVSSTTAAPSTTEAATTAPSTTGPTTTQVRLSASGAVGLGELTGCRRADSGVVATVSVSHRSGPPSMFAVTAAIVDSQGSVTDQATARTDQIERGATVDVDVVIPVDGEAAGACELIDVTGVTAS